MNHALQPRLTSITSCKSSPYSNDHQRTLRCTARRPPKPPVRRPPDSGSKFSRIRSPNPCRDFATTNLARGSHRLPISLLQRPEAPRADARIRRSPTASRHGDIACMRRRALPASALEPIHRSEPRMGNRNERPKRGPLIAATEYASREPQRDLRRTMAPPIPNKLTFTNRGIPYGRGSSLIFHVFWAEDLPANAHLCRPEPPSRRPTAYPIAAPANTHLAGHRRQKSQLAPVLSATARPMASVGNRSRMFSPCQDRSSIPTDTGACVGPPKTLTLSTSILSGNQLTTQARPHFPRK